MSYTTVSSHSETPHSRNPFKSTADTSGGITFRDPNAQSHLSKRASLTRLSIFLILELGYIALAITCYRKPLLLPSSLTSTESKGILTVIFIAWQTLATIPIYDIVIHVFSSEWSVHLSRTGHLVPGMTDKVSTLNASVLDRVRHLFVGVASMSFRVAFIASITVTAINGLAPGTFITSSVPINRPITLPIGNLTLTTTRPSLDARQVFPLQRAELVTRLERVEKDQFGYDVQPNWIVGWPPLDLRLKGKVEYPSDGVRYQYECTWEPPVFQSGRWTTRRGTWGIWTSVLVPQEDKLSSFGALVLPLAQGSLNVTSRSAYLFLGSNSTLDPTTAAGFRNSTLDLSGIPATYNASGFVLTDGANRSETGFYAPPLATVLECDPRMNISSVTVALETNQALRVVSDSSSPARIGNIPEGAATILLSQALLSATSTPEPYGDTNTVMNYVCASMFMADPSLSSDSGTRPLDLATISANVDAYMSSASKAYAGGYQPADDSLPIGNFSTMLVNGEMEEHKVALVTNKRLMITTIVLVGVTALLSAAITLREEEGRRPFSLMSIMWEVERRQLDLQQL